MLEGFKPIILTAGLPYMSVSKNGITFNKTAVIKMGKAEFVTLLINIQERKIAIQKDDIRNENSAVFFRKGARYTYVKWNYSDLLCTISKLMDWDLNRYSYKVAGELMSEEMAMIFDLTQAQTLSVDSKEEKDAAE